MFETLPNPMNKIKILPLAIALALSGCGSDETTPVDTGSHVASPDWQDQIIYFLMIDRFNDGDSALNDQGQKFWAKGATDCALSATSNWLQ